MSDLLPCPFCGGEARIVEGEESAYVQCREVKMHRAMFFDGDNDAASVVAGEWNRRAIPSADARAERDALRAKVAELTRERDEATAGMFEWVKKAEKDAARLSALTAQNQTWQRNSRETFDAMVAMRNSINEHLPMPSLESDLLQGPENSVFCAAVAEAVVSEVSRLRAKVARLEEKAVLWDSQGHDASELRDLTDCLDSSPQPNDKLRQMYADYRKAISDGRLKVAPTDADLRAKVARLEGALVDHNDLLRSALSIAKREGVDGEVASTNWDAYYNRVAVVLKRHHQIANEARAALTDGAADE